MLIKRAVLILILRPFLVATQYMIADIFTKAVEKATFVRLRNSIMNANGGLREALACAVHSVHGDTRRMVSRLHSQL